MIGCTIVLQILAITEFRYIEFETASLEEAQRLAALEAGRIGGIHSSSHETNFGFECAGSGWVAVGLDQHDAFASPKRRRSNKG